jgi:type IV pilus biogenesis protein PilP
MKPNFALILGYDGIELAQRTPGGWQSVGRVAFDRPDLDAAIEALVVEARSLAPEGVLTKLVVPDSEVRYATVLAPGPTDEARRYQIEAEVEGLTPYRIDDLAYDWVIEGDHAQVAIVARETLREAEEFAAERGFNPVSFVARPEAGQFMGEPFFGQTGASRALLPEGAGVTPDADPLRLTGKVAPVPPTAPVAPPAPAAPVVAPPPRAEAPPASVAAPVAAHVAQPDAVPAPVAPPPPSPRPAPQVAAPAPAPAPAPATAAEGPAPAARPALTMPPIAAEATRKVGDLVRRMGTRLRREQVEANQTGTATDTRIAAVARLAPDASPAAAEAQAEVATGSAIVAFSSRRAVGGGATTRGIPAGVPPRNPEPPPSTRPGSASPGGRLAILPRAEAAAARMDQLTRRGRDAMRTAIGAIGALSLKPGKAGAGAPGRPAPVQSGPAQTSPVVTAFDAPTARPRPVEALPGSRPPANPREKATEAEALTLFGRRGQAQPTRSLAGPVLMAAGAVVALLAAVAVWALYFSGPAPVQTAQVPEVAAPAAAPVSAPEGAVAAAPADPEPVQPAPAAETLPPATEAAEAELSPFETDPAVLAERLAAEALAEAQPAEVLDRLVSEQPVEPADPVPDATTAEAGAAAGAELTPAAPVAVAAPQPQPEAAEATRAATGTGPLTLPGRLIAPPVAEVAPISPAPPPPFEVAALQAQLPAEPAPENTATPAPEAPADPEVAVQEGRPAVVPPPAPGRPAPVSAPAGSTAAPAAPATAEVTAAPEATPPQVADDTPRADPALAGFRPEARSARVRALGEALRAAQPPAPAEAAPAPEPAGRLDQGSLAQPIETVAIAEATTTAAAEPPPGGVALSLLRPLRRPTDLVPDPTAEAPVVEEPAEVVARSMLPAQRPQSLAARVEATLAAQARERERVQQARAAAAAAAAARASAPPAAAPAQQAAAVPRASTARAAAVAAEEEPEESPDAYAAGPETPTTASVAQAATQQRAIRTRDANLIGVFGSPSNRRALVRMPNGDVVRLQVGDRFDGGQVSAIGDSELRYVRSGQDMVLRIASRG